MRRTFMISHFCFSRIYRWYTLSQISYVQQSFLCQKNRNYFPKIRNALCANHRPFASSKLDSAQSAVPTIPQRQPRNAFDNIRRIHVIEYNGDRRPLLSAPFLDLCGMVQSVSFTLHSCTPGRYRYLSVRYSLSAWMKQCRKLTD